MWDREDAIAAVSLLLLVLLTFGQALLNQYAYDSAVVMSRLVAPGAPIPFAGLFSPADWSELTGVMSWRPLTLAVFLGLDVHLFGSTPWLSHALNLLLHALNSFLVYTLLRRWPGFGTGWLIPALAAAAFAVHPLVSETVLCVGFRFDLLVMALVLSGALVALRSAGTESWSPAHFTGTAICCAILLLALGAKETAVLGLFLMPALYHLRKRCFNESAVLFACLLIVTFCFFQIWRLFRFEDYPTSHLGGGGRTLGIANFLVSFWELYFHHLLIPWPLRIDHDFLAAESLASARSIVAIGLTLVAGAGALALARKSSLVAIGVLWIVVGFAPVSQVVPVPDPVAERFAYIPMGGAALLLAALLQGARARYPASWRPLVLACGGLIALWAAISHVRSLDWRDDLTLNIRNWEAVSLRSERGEETLAGLYLTRAPQRMATGDRAGVAADLRGAAQALDRLLARNPISPAAWRLRAVQVMMAGGPAEEAQAAALEAVRLAPNDPDAQRVLAAAEAYTAP